MCNRDPIRKLLRLAAFALSAALAAAQSPAPPTPQPAPTPRPAHTTLVPLRPPTPEEIGDSLMAHKRYQAAITAFKNAIRDTREKPALATLWNKLGIAYQMMFNLDEATDCYRKSLRLDPHNMNVLNNLGTVYDSKKDYKGAIRMYRKALKVDPRSAVVYKNLGTALLARRKYKEGSRAYQSALALDPDIFGTSTDSRPRAQNPSTLQQRGAMNYYMAQSCARAGMPIQAIAYLRVALNEGFTTPSKIASDTEFASLRDIPAFQKLLAEEKPR
ncbi:MAG TPA: tetratricopeptide repeat protein [Terracidiphilus sp.]|nr:tetratricopeptide repeat protein [Terracidiphilus sp.]